MNPIIPIHCAKCGTACDLSQQAVNDFRIDPTNYTCIHCDSKANRTKATNQRITVQVFENGKALGEGIASLVAETEQEAVDVMFRHMRIDRQFRFLGSHGFIIPTGMDGDRMLFNGGRA